jgi:acetylornithine deacetylase/succinyl-diaminopimelate desuccinylase-like protein
MGRFRATGKLRSVEEEAAVESGTQLGADAVALLGDLIRLNTVNPPGNERPAQELLAETLTDAGFSCELRALEESRPNLVARLRGEAPGETLCLLGHTDTVPADPSEWTFDPWAGDVVDGEVRGRGAQDMKGQVAAEVAACAALGRSGWRPASGDLLVVITADEEMGAEIGAQYLTTEHADEVRCDLVLNEGGGIAVDYRGRRFYTLAVGEKGVFRFLLRARGRAGHASMPSVGENALLKLAPLVAKLTEQPPREPEDEALRLLRELGEDVDSGGLADVVERAREANRELTDYLIEPMLGATLVPTRAWASDRDNVIPSHAEVLVDCRTPPGMGEDGVRERVDRILGGDGYELEFTEHVVGTKSSPDTRLFEAVSDWVAEADPGAGVVPVVMAGFSDSHWFRRAFGAVSYGFCPQNGMSLAEMEPLVHGADERAKAADIELAARFFNEIVTEVLG